MARTKVPDSEPTNADPVDIPGIAPPPGVSAKVKTTVDYNLNVDPDAPELRAPRGARATRFTDLDDLAIEEAEVLQPPDALSAFFEQCEQYIGANCEIIRLPDPADKRMPGSRYARCNFGEYERLGGIPFDPLTLQASVQMLNGNSGGVFRLFLTDQYGRMIPGARLERLALADPLGAGNATSGQPSHTLQPGQSYGQPAPISIEREPSEMEKQMQRLQTRLLENALERAMNPPQPAPAQINLPDEDRLALLLLQKGDLLGNVVNRIAGLAQAPEAIEKATWKDKLIELAANNPTLVARVNDTVGRIADRLFSGPAPAYIPPPPTQHAPQATPGAQAAAQGFSNMPSEAPDADIDDPEFDTPEDEDMALLEDVIDLLSGSEPLTRDNPILKQLADEYPRRFPLYVRMIAQLPNADAMLHFAATQSKLYATLLNGPMQPHYQARANELRQLCIELLTPRPAPVTEPAPEPEAAPQ